MKAILEFDLDNPDDKMAHARAIKSTDMALVLWKFGHNTRKTIEWAIEDGKLDADQTLDKIYEEFWEMLEANGIILDELID